MVELYKFDQDPESLVVRYLDDPRPDLKDLIIVEYSGLVERIARRFSGIEPFDDLVQVGYIGLLNALSKFDVNAGVRFNTYATHLVAGEIKHYLRDRSQVIRHPAWLQELRQKVHRAALMLQSEFGRQPTEREIAEHLQVSESTVRDVFATQEMLRVASLDSTPNDEDGDTDLDRIDSADFCPEQLTVEDRVVLESAISQLRELEQKVLVAFHFDAKSQTEIATELGISCNYVSHILRQSLSKLRRILSNEEASDRMLSAAHNVVQCEELDDVTGIYSENYFRKRLTEEVHRAVAEDSVIGVMLIDFQGIKQLQSFYGDDSVRDLLLDVADFLKDNVRRLDIVCRWGATGFGIILPATGPNVEVLEDRIRSRFEAWLGSRTTPSGPIRARTGSTFAPDFGRTVEELIEKANPLPVAVDFRQDLAA
ncbi:MAG: RNA polymerase sigma factor FliA [Fimbriimonadaceae bacterium]|nr:RNA polymerase sigma factor FliA [Fimbriimonadaceae bacterium]